MPSNQVLSPEQIQEFRRTGHLTVPGVFDARLIQAAIDDLTAWGSDFLRNLSEQDRRWYIEQDSGEQAQLRKLDNPVFHRQVFRELAQHASVVAIVEQLIGSGVSVFFSQVFMKPPGIGGPKPIHQDNFYFGPDRPDATLTAWIALDDATTENGCLYYCDVHQDQVVPHIAPADEPYNLQIPGPVAIEYEMMPAPVPSGGVSFHHGNTPHQSSVNRSLSSRRAAAFHYLRNDASLVSPALPYDQAIHVKIT